MSKPNILVILTDQHNKHVLGCYGDPLVRTPHLDRLAAEGMRFDSAYCPAPVCVPSRMSFMTCQSPSFNQVWDNAHSLNSGIPTWANWLTLAGYETALLGRMHFVGPDQRHGFEQRPIGEAMAGPPGMTWRGGPAWQHYSAASTGQSRTCVEIGGRGKTFYQWEDEERTRFTCDWLREKAQGEERPFAAVLGYVLPHCPFIAPQELFDYYYDNVEIPTVEDDLPPAVQRFRELRRLTDPPLPEERIRVARAAYYGLCEHIDSLIGQVLAVLEETGLADNTLVIYTSDHGELAGEHGCWWKSTYYEGGAGVPMIARWPGQIPAGTVNPAVCNLSDLGTTFAEIAGYEIPYPTTGRSLLRHLTTGEDPDWEDVTCCEFVDMKCGRTLPSRMIRSGPWKLWLHTDEDDLPPVLFNLKDDPEERHDLGRDPAYAEVRDVLLERLWHGWDPQTAATLSQRQTEAYHLLREWGQAVDVQSDDALALPPSDYEAQVELL